MCLEILSVPCLRAVQEEWMGCSLKRDRSSDLKTGQTPRMQLHNAEIHSPKIYNKTLFS